LQVARKGPEWIRRKPRNNGTPIIQLTVSRLVKIAAAATIGIILLLVVALFALHRVIEAGEFRRLLIAELEQRTELKANIGAVDIKLGGVTGISLKDFSLVDPETSRPVLTAPEVVTRVALLPLWEWQVVIHSIRFRQPVFQVHRDPDGKIDWADLWGRILFDKRKDFPFALDLKEIRIEEAQVSFLDEHAGPAPLVTNFRRVDLTLRRAGGRGLPGLIRAARVAGEREEKPALEYRLTSTVEREGRHAEISSRGKIEFGGEDFQLPRARFEADFQVERWPSGLLEEYYQKRLPLGWSRGILSARLRVDGSRAGSGRLTGDIELKDLQLDGSQMLLEKTVSPGDGRLEFQLEWQPNEVRFTRLELRSEEIGFSARGSVLSSPDGDSHVQFRFSTPFLRLPAARGYLPAAVLQSPGWRSLAQAVTQGEIRLSSLVVSGRLSEIRGLSAAASSPVSLAAELRGAAADLPGAAYLPLRNLSGSIVVEKDVLSFNGFRGSYGRSRFDDLSGFRKADATGNDLVELRARGEADLEELHQQLKTEVFPEAARRAASQLEVLNGKAGFAVSLRTDFKSLYEYHGVLSLTDAALQTGGIALKAVNGPVRISPKEILGEKIVAAFAGSPLSVGGFVRDYASEKASFDLTVESAGLRAGAVSRLLLNTGSIEDPGTVRGWLRYQGPVGAGAERKLSGVLELSGTRPPLEFFREPPRQVSGIVKLDGKAIELQGIRAKVGNFEIDFSGQLNLGEQPRLIFALSAPEMDIGMLLPKEISDSKSAYDRFQANGKVSFGKGRFEAFEFADFKTDLYLEGRLWRLENFSAGSAGGTIRGRASFLDRPKGLDYVLEPQVQGVPVQRLLGWFDIGTREITGNVNLTGKMESSGSSRPERKRNMNGHFKLEIQDGIARRLTLLVRILQVMDLTRWFSFKLPDLKQQGIRFRSITGDFKVAQGVYMTENLVVDSDDISITGAGQYDAPNDVIDAVVALRPFPRLGSVVSQIPLIGPGIAGIQDSILVASFRVKGPVEEAVITPAPLSTLSEFFYSALRIPKRMLTLPRAENK
jgi:uncharacterized protein YhdP